MEEEFFIISFESTHYAMLVENKLKEAELKVNLIPTPRIITASCGLSLKIDSDVMEDVSKALKSYDLDATMFQIYRVIKNGNENKAIPINIH
ncbi:MAG: DUF3343 domain-containing protein [Bacillota bacterium]|jgi:hypothetical protein|nr:DUF3343 domain-containing protein [Clostridia bacterium]